MSTTAVTTVPLEMVDEMNNNLDSDGSLNIKKKQIQIVKFTALTHFLVLKLVKIWW